MSIDKFGKTLRSTRIDYDIANKGLKHINYPIDELDACPKKYVDELLTDAIVWDSKKNFNALRLRISNVAELTNAHDVCLKKYLDNSVKSCRKKI